ncbi:hypothetical protein GQ43DRAFT_458832 [Delitschia confertaspora ATCC 74209]|uniref:Impact N-terminal domain-containing protein n=1 Tax=Delitschia confertaspora ATCC 74209 TaxID=1513339 RepID=A0A9P4MLC7_9PLEO|nr:hypothetical protein GQ43DRAFT_458832 [Delitschia confertaspora ATCC 74209]
MPTAQDIHTLLRFLSQDAKVPLAQAMGKVKELQKAGLGTPSEIAKSDIESIKSIFTDEKIAKQVLNTAKRVSKKRAASDTPSITTPKKSKRSYGSPLSPPELEESLALPEPCMDEDVLSKTIVYTNRAPLVLAFVLTLIKYTMPGQPLSSRLSLAQAVVSVNSRAKAVSLGLESGNRADEEGWGEGQPVCKIMGREIRVMKRWGYQWKEMKDYDASIESGGGTENFNEQPPLWGVDLEALKKSNGPVTPGSASSSQLPIYTAHSARAYILRSFGSPKLESEETEPSPANKKSNAETAVVAEREKNLGLLLGALELLLQSWSTILTKEELDKRAWGWYVRIRPEVESGVAGWGGKGNVKLADILSLRRQETR